MSRLKFILLGGLIISLTFSQIWTHYKILNLSHQLDQALSLPTNGTSMEAPVQDSATNPLPQPTTDEATAASQSTLLQQQITELQASNSSLTQRVETLENRPATIQTSNTTTTNFDNFQTQIIYLGSTNTNQQSWTNTGLEIKLNSADYPPAAKVVFEAGISIIGGEGWARLVNKTTGAVISVSEIYSSSSTSSWQSSASFNLHPGQNTYELQVRSTSGETAHFSGARLIISK